MNTVFQRVVITAIVISAVVSGAGTSNADPRGIDRFAAQQLRWQPCGDRDLDRYGARCAEVIVPVDYGDPTGSTMRIAISRLRAGDPKRRRGIMLSNPGGPGGPGLSLPARLRNRFSPQVLTDYDLIGLDPRGIGRSAPVNCGWKVPTVFLSAGFDAVGFAREVGYHAAVAASCSVIEYQRIRHITTRNTARDLDLVRRVLGESKINYYGTSYGTYLGAVYTQMFPEQVDRMVLDSALDPDRYWHGTRADMGPANEAAWDDFAQWAAARDRQYHLGATVAAVRGIGMELLRRIARRPIPCRGFFLDEHSLPVIWFAMLSNPAADELLAIGLRQFADAVFSGSQLRLDPRVQEFLDGQQTLNHSAMAAITCGDTAAVRDPRWYWRNIEASRGAQPMFGAMANNITPCAFWPPPLEPATRVHNAVPTLIVQATRDPRTTYPQGVALHRKLTGSRLITLQDVRIHGAFRPGLSSCVNAAVNRYFEVGVLPDADTVCRAD